MSVLFVALPAALAMAALAVAAFAASVRGGQFDDLETPPLRMLFDDPPEPAITARLDARLGNAGSPPRRQLSGHAISRISRAAAFIPRK